MCAALKLEDGSGIEKLFNISKVCLQLFCSNIRPFQERRAIARARAHTHTKVFRRVINRTRKWNLTTGFYYIIACVWSSMWLYYTRVKQCFFSSTFFRFSLMLTMYKKSILVVFVWFAWLLSKYKNSFFLLLLKVH